MVSMLWYDLAFFDWLKKQQALGPGHCLGPMHQAHAGEVLARITTLLLATMLNDDQVGNVALKTILSWSFATL